jgi:hypothetical protein
LETGLSQFALDWIAFKAAGSGLELDSDYLKNEIMGERKIREAIKYSHTRTHKGDAVTVYKLLERPVGRDEMLRYYAEQLKQELGTAPLLDEMKTHWSVPERLQYGPAYPSEAKSFNRLDKKFASIPAIDRNESLFPY